MTEISNRGFPRVLKKVMKAVRSGPDKFYVAIDVSVFEPAGAPAGSGGLSVREITGALRSICATSDVVGVAITDAGSMPHASRRSSPATNTVLNDCLVGIAVRESGLSPEFVQPLAQGY